MTDQPPDMMSASVAKPERMPCRNCPHYARGRAATPDSIPRQELGKRFWTEVIHFIIDTTLEAIKEFWIKAIKTVIWLLVAVVALAIFDEFGNEQKIKAPIYRACDVILDRPVGQSIGGDGLSMSPHPDSPLGALIGGNTAASMPGRKAELCTEPR